jgi:hypothetical protein
MFSLLFAKEKCDNRVDLIASWHSEDFTCQESPPLEHLQLL